MRCECVQKGLALWGAETLMHVGQHLCLFGDCSGDGGMHMTQDIDPVVTHRIEITLAVRVPKIGPVTAHQGDSTIGIQLEPAKPGFNRLSHRAIDVPAPESTL